MLSISRSMLLTAGLMAFPQVLALRATKELLIQKRRWCQEKHRVGLRAKVRLMAPRVSHPVMRPLGNQEKLSKSSGSHAGDGSGG
jgi:hypothetical protein